MCWKLLRAAKPYRANVPNCLVSGTPAGPAFGSTGALWNLSFVPTAGGMVGRMICAHDMSNHTSITSSFLVLNKYHYLFADACTLPLPCVPDNAAVSLPTLQRRASASAALHPTWRSRLSTVFLRFFSLHPSKRLTFIPLDNDCDTYPPDHLDQ